MANINTHCGSLELSDILADGDSKLVAAHYGSAKNDLKLKVFKGASLIKENNLVDTPTAILSIYMDNLQPRVPGNSLYSKKTINFYIELFSAIAVASGSSIYVYKNLKPGFQFNFPPLEVSGVEKDIWGKAKDVFYLLKSL